MARVNTPQESEESPTLDRVLSAAAELFRTRGYAATTTREIAARLGIQKASLYYHISSKEDLLYELTTSTLRANLKAIRAAIVEPGDAFSRLSKTVTAHLVGMHSEPDKNGTALTEMRALEGERLVDVVKLRDEYEALFRGVIEEGQRQGIIRNDLHARYLTLALLSMTNWTLVWYHPGGELTVEELAQVMLTVFLDGALKNGRPHPKLPRNAAAGRRINASKAASPAAASRKKTRKGAARVK
jgi:TetR/AcrR family transcriptional regulator, cholesterol catabolism regulator